MTRTAARWTAPLALLGLVLAGCGGSSSDSAPAGTASHSTTDGSSSGSSTGAAPTPASSTPAPGFASTSAGTPRGVLSKPDFLIRMNEVCSSFDARFGKLPEPTAATDFVAITANLTGNLRLMPPYLSQARALVSQTAERAALEKNWLAIARSEFAAFAPLAQQMIEDSNAHDAAKVQADANAMSALPDQSRTMAAYLSRYGLSSCAHLHSQ
jgi:hypothetical protein